MGRRFTSVKGIDAFGKVRFEQYSGSRDRAAGRVELTGFADLPVSLIDDGGCQDQDGIWRIA